MRKILSRFAAPLAILALLSVAGCSGGSGGGSSTPSASSTPVTPPAVTASLATISPYSPETGATGVSASSTITINLVVANAATADAHNVSVICNNKSVSFGSASALSSDGTFMLVTLTPAPASAPAEVASDLCAYSGTIVVSGSAGGSVMVSVSSSFTIAAVPPPTCVAPQVLNSGTGLCVTPPVVTPTCSDSQQVWIAGFKMCGYKDGVDVSKSTQIPAGCPDARHQCFADLVASGKLILVSTPARATSTVTDPTAPGYLSPAQHCPIVAAPVITSVGYDFVLFCADTGLPWDGLGAFDSGTNMSFTLRGVANGFNWSFADGRIYNYLWFPYTTDPTKVSDTWYSVRLQ